MKEHPGGQSHQYDREHLVEDIGRNVFYQSRTDLRSQDAPQADQNAQTVIHVI